MRKPIALALTVLLFAGGCSAFRNESERAGGHSPRVFSEYAEGPVGYRQLDGFAFQVYVTGGRHGYGGGFGMSWAAVALRSLEEQRQFLRDYPPAKPVVYFVDGERIQTQQQFPAADYTSETVVVLKRGGPTDAIRIDSVIARPYGASQAAFVYATLVERPGRLHAGGAGGPTKILALEGANRDVMFSWRSDTIEP